MVLVQFLLCASPLVLDSMSTSHGSAVCRAVTLLLAEETQVCQLSGEVAPAVYGDTSTLNLCSQARHVFDGLGFVVATGVCLHICLL